MPTETWEQIEEREQAEKTQRRAMWKKLPMFLLALGIFWNGAYQFAAQRTREEIMLADWKDHQQNLQREYIYTSALASQSDEYGYFLLIQVTGTTAVEMDNERESMSSADRAATPSMEIKFSSCLPGRIAGFVSRSPELKAACQKMVDGKK